MTIMTGQFLRTVRYAQGSAGSTGLKGEPDIVEWMRV